jgi:hypothetical protein
LGVGDRYDGRLAKCLIQRHQIRDIETPMKPGEERRDLPTRQGKVEIVNVEVGDLPTGRPSENQF